jgi:pseudaminic acid synthase
LPYEWHQPLQEHAARRGLVFFSSPFDLEAVDFLESLDVPIYKIASPEINDLPLIRRAAQTGRPIIISTGIAEIGDVEAAIQTCRDAGNNDITILKCTSQYPATIQEANLLTIPDMIQRFGVNVGLSDHTMGSTVPVMAVALGARVIEKHFILDRSLGGPDSAFSMEPEEFADMVISIRAAESALGDVSYTVTEKDKLRRRSLFVTKDIAAGERITLGNVRSIRPGHGIPPGDIEKVLGRMTRRDLPAGTPLRWEELS